MAKAANATNLSRVKTCETCGASFMLKRGSRPTTRYCGRSCAAVAVNRARTDHTPETLMTRFWAKVDKTPGFGPRGDCWHWTARVDGRGYGEIKIAGQYKKAHRLALFGPGDMENPLFACHRCDNPRCVRPDHLFAGEAVDNVRDMHRKGRAPQLRGGSGPSARKLTAEDVLAIRASPLEHARLARRYGVDPMVIYRVRKRLTYRNVA